MTRRWTGLSVRSDSEITGKHPARVALSIAAGTAIWQQELDNG